MKSFEETVEVAAIDSHGLEGSSAIRMLSEVCNLEGDENDESMPKSVADLLYAGGAPFLTIAFAIGEVLKAGGFPTLRWSRVADPLAEVKRIAAEEIEAIRLDRRMSIILRDISGLRVITTSGGEPRWAYVVNASNASDTHVVVILPVPHEEGDVFTEEERTIDVWFNDGL